jgi:hypothetical protein
MSRKPRQKIAENPVNPFRIVSIKNLRKDSVPQPPVFAVLIGVAQFVQHYVAIRKSPNAEFAFDAKDAFLFCQPRDFQSAWRSRGTRSETQ